MHACKYNWPAAERSYIQAPDSYPHVSLKDISERYDIPYQTVRRYAAKQKWVSQRDLMYYNARKLKEPRAPQYHGYSTKGMPRNVVNMLQKLSNANISN